MTLQTRTREQAQRLIEDRENRVYLAGVELPRELRIEHLDAGLARADYVLLGVPSTGLGDVIGTLEARGLPANASVVSLAKGLVPPEGTPPTVILRRQFGARRTACVGGPAHAREMVSEGAGLVAASTEESLATALAGVFIRAGVVCEESNDPIGVERGTRLAIRRAPVPQHQTPSFDFDDRPHFGLHALLSMPGNAS